MHCCYSFRADPAHFFDVYLIIAPLQSYYCSASGIPLQHLCTRIIAVQMITCNLTSCQLCSDSGQDQLLSGRRCCVLSASHISMNIETDYELLLYRYHVHALAALVVWSYFYMWSDLGPSRPCCELVLQLNGAFHALSCFRIITCEVT
jgi:hypothetical protein